MKLFFRFLLAVILVTYHNESYAQLFPIEIKGKFGYVDASGELVIQPIYDLAMPFNQGYAVAALNLQPCLINVHNKRVIDTGIYRQIAEYSEGLCMAEDYKHNKYYVDTLNTIVISLPKEVYEARPFRYGIAVLSMQTTYTQVKFNKEITTIVYRFGYMDKGGNMLSGFDYEDCGDFFNGYSRAIKGSKFGLLSTSMKEVLPFTYTYLSQVNEQKIVVNDNNKFGVYHVIDNRWVVKPSFPLIYDFSEGMAGFMNEKNKYGYINELGEIVIKPLFGSIAPFSEQKAAVFAEGKWGFINKQGQWVIKNVFDNARFFSEGMCAVMYKRKWGFINEEGRLLIPCEFDEVGNFNDGLALIVLNDVTVYINKRGAIMPQLKK